MSSEVPEGWTTTPLASCGDWLSGGTPSRRNPEYWGGRIPWISAKSLHDFYVIDSEERVTAEGAENGTRRVPPGTILMVVRGMSLANDFRVGITRRDVTFNQDLKAIRPDESVVEPLFLGFFLQGAEREVLGMVSTASHGTCKLDTGRLGALRVLVPPLAEQKRIAAILSAVDAAIESTRAVIEQTRQVKLGALQDLLSRGVQETGLPHRRFRDTALGSLPATWRVATVESLLADITPAMRSGPFGSALLKSELVDEGIPLLGIDNVHVEHFKADFSRFVTPDKFEQLKRYAVRSGDVMITIMGTVGRSCVVPEDVGQALSSKHTWTLTFDRAKYLPYLACLQFNHAPWVLAHFRADEQGGTMSAIRSATLRSARLPVPPMDEQERIRDVFLSLDAEIRGHEAQLASLQHLKAGLLQDLLTGAVRVGV